MTDEARGPASAVQAFRNQISALKEEQLSCVTCFVEGRDLTYTYQHMRAALADIAQRIGSLIEQFVSKEGLPLEQVASEIERAGWQPSQCLLEAGVDEEFVAALPQPLVRDTVALKRSARLQPRPVVASLRYFLK